MDHTATLALILAFLSIFTLAAWRMRKSAAPVYRRGGGMRPSKAEHRRYAHNNTGQALTHGVSGTRL